jgi:hypothetical protein
MALRVLATLEVRDAEISALKAEVRHTALEVAASCTAGEERDCLREALQRIEALHPPTTCVVMMVDVPSGEPCDRTECVGCIARKALTVKP